MTSEQLPPALAEKFARLERKVRSARLTVLIWVALALLLMWMRFYDRDVILSNKVSQTTAALETVASGKTGLYLFDPQHTIRAELDNRSVSFVTDFPSANLLLSPSIRRAVVIQSVGD